MWNPNHGQHLGKYGGWEERSQPEPDRGTAKPIHNLCLPDGCESSLSEIMRFIGGCKNRRDGAEPRCRQQDLRRMKYFGPLCRSRIVYVHLAMGAEKRLRILAFHVEEWCVEGNCYGS